MDNQDNHPDDNQDNNPDYNPDEDPDLQDYNDFGIEVTPDDEAIDLPENMGEEDIAGYMDDMDMEGMEEEMEGEEIPDHAVTVFAKHQPGGAVFCCAVDPQNSVFAASGGEDDKGYVWEIATGNDILECSGHKDSVTAIAFSHDSKFVASGDMEGNIKVWKIENKEEIWETSVGEDLEWLQWHHATHVLLGGFGLGNVWMWKVPSGECKMFQNNSAPTSASVGNILPDGKSAIVGFGDGQVRLLDLKSGDARSLVSGGPKGEEKGIVCLDYDPRVDAVAAGGTDVKVRIINIKTGKTNCTFDCTCTKAKGDGADDDEEIEDAVEAVQFCKSDNLMATGTLLGSLRIWDLKSQSCRHEFKCQNGITRILWHPDKPIVFVSSLDGSVVAYDGLQGVELNRWTGHTSHILDMKLTSNKEKIVTCSDDGSCRVFALT